MKADTIIPADQTYINYYSATVPQENSMRQISRLSGISEAQSPKAFVLNDDTSSGTVEEYDPYHPSYVDQKLKFSSEAPPRITLLGKSHSEEINKSDKELLNAIKCLPKGLQLEIMKFIPDDRNAILDPVLDAKIISDEKNCRLFYNYINSGYSNRSNALYKLECRYDRFMNDNNLKEGMGFFKRDFSIVASDLAEALIAMKMHNLSKDRLAVIQERLQSAGPLEHIKHNVLKFLGGSYKAVLNAPVELAVKPATAMYHLNKREDFNNVDCSEIAATELNFFLAGVLSIVPDTFSKALYVGKRWNRGSDRLANAYTFPDINKVYKKEKALNLKRLNNINRPPKSLAYRMGRLFKFDAREKNHLSGIIKGERAGNIIELAKEHPFWQFVGSFSESDTAHRPSSS